MKINQLSTKALFLFSLLMTAGTAIANDFEGKNIRVKNQYTKECIFKIDNRPHQDIKILGTCNYKFPTMGMMVFQK